MTEHSSADVKRLLVVLPSWVGDAVMATPTLRALRRLYPDATIVWLVRPYVKPVLDGLPWCDRRIIGRRTRGRGPGFTDLVARLRRERFDATVLLPNSFRSAALVRLGGVRRCIGYDRDGRGWLLTDRLLPLRAAGRFVPVPAVDYYLGLARYLGADRPDRRVELAARQRDERRADRLLREGGVDGQRRPLVLLNPGAANHGDAKLWPAERFAAVADALIERHGATVLVNGAPSERAVLDAVHAAARSAAGGLVDLPALGGSLPTLKGIAQRCDLVIGNDSGARHVAVAMGAPTLSLFGPTDPEWTRLALPHERVIVSPDGRMSGISTDEVIEAAERMLQSGAQGGQGSGRGSRAIES